MATFGAMLRVPQLMSRLFVPALQISAIEHPDLPDAWAKPWLDRMHGICGEVARGTPIDAPIRDRVDALARVLYGHLGFGGNAQYYKDPRNSCLTDVIERRTGTPISLAVVLMTAARDVGLDIKGVGAPEHFLCRFNDEEGTPWFIDPFDQGRVFDIEEARGRVRACFDDIDPQVADHLLRPVGTPEILARILHNMKATYATRGHANRLLAVLDWLILLQPANVGEIRNRGMVLLTMGQVTRAAQDLAFYIEQAPEASDLDHIREALNQALASLARSN